ncbi:phosphate acetyltransferase [Desulfocapsa sulfexigens DSM 10523]|uniref:Phosphate acetyltransferase n=1 Tax=Desulfocapsa sulfexigens (strain DSM 10523 / SB164P1) TaxID=1167006 RepID=M1NBB6_DESSD|nr:phosphate acetyltransferase [Desulfocapsa sulfexigens]AGF77094.1 phosphate acetyltransferase [Desulfocapsa sulfexigens DSM 10523]
MHSNTLYIASLEPEAGKLVVTMGIMEFLSRSVGNVAFFRPVIDTERDIDPDINLIRGRYCPNMSYEESYGFQASEVKSFVAEGRIKFFLEELLNKLTRLKEQYDFVLCQGLNATSFLSAFDLDINMEIAKNLGCPFIGVINGMNQTSRDIAKEIQITEAAITESGCTHFATFVNRMAKDTLGVLEVELDDPDEASGAPVFLLPENEELDKPSLAGICDALGCANILDRSDGMDRIVKQFKIAAMTMEHFLSHVEDGDLIIVPGDRDDIVLASISTLFSANYPNVAGILLTGGFLPGANTMRLITGRERIVPLLSVTTDTYSTTRNVAAVPALINPGDERKIALALGLFETHVNSERLRKMTELSTTPETVTPIMFEYGLFERARSAKKHIVLPEASDERILRATEILLRRNVVDITLLGKPEEITAHAASLGLDIKKARLIDPSTSELTEEFIQTFYKLRKHKNMTPDGARDAMSNLSYFGTMMVYEGMADGMVSGAIHTTADTIRPALQIIKTIPGISVVSSVFLMCLDTRVLVYGDCAVNPDPNAAQLAEIAISSADTATTFGIEPRLAMLSYSTGASGKGVDVEKVRTATTMAREKRPDLLIEGPIQYDAAIDLAVAKTKMPDSLVAGRATVFIFPDLNTGNNTYKAVQRSSGAVAIGPVLQGLKKPVNDLSRGCLVADIVNTVAITAIQAQSIQT